MAPKTQKILDHYYKDKQRVIIQDGTRIRKGFNSPMTRYTKIVMANTRKFAMLRSDVDSYMLFDIEKRKVLNKLRVEAWTINPIFSPDDTHVITITGINIQIHKIIENGFECVFSLASEILTKENFDFPVTLTFDNLMANSIVWITTDEFAFFYLNRILVVNFRTKHVKSVFTTNVYKICGMIYDPKADNLVCWSVDSSHTILVDIQSGTIIAKFRPEDHHLRVRSFIFASPSILIGFDAFMNRLVKIEYPSMKIIKNHTVWGSHMNLSSIPDGKHFMLHGTIRSVDTLEPVDCQALLKPSNNRITSNNKIVDAAVTSDGTTLINICKQFRSLGIYNIHPPFVPQERVNFNHFQSLMLGGRLKRKLPKHLMFLIAKYSLN